MVKANNEYVVLSWWSLPKEELIMALNVNVQSGLTKKQVNDYPMPCIASVGTYLRSGPIPL